MERIRDGKRARLFQAITADVDNDAELDTWLEAYENARWPPMTSAHGYAFRASRNLTSVDGGWADTVVPLLPGYETWIAGP